MNHTQSVSHANELNQTLRRDVWLGDVTTRTSNLRSRDRWFDSQSGRYQVVTTWIGDCLRTGKPIQYITNHQLSLPSLWGR